MPEANPIAAILEYSGADLHRVRERGWHPVKCPYHDDRQASASVNLEKGAFRCHGCGVKGTAVALVMNQEGLNFQDAVRRTEEISGTSLGDVRKSAPNEKPRRVSRWRDRLFA